MLEKENLPALLLGLAVGLASAPDPMAVGDSLLGRVGESAGGGVFLQSVAISCPRLGSLLLALGEDIVFGKEKICFVVLLCFFAEVGGGGEWFVWFKLGCCRISAGGVHGFVVGFSFVAVFALPALFIPAPVTF